MDGLDGLTSTSKRINRRQYFGRSLILLSLGVVTPNRYDSEFRVTTCTGR
jgi:hypothetical protein